MGYRREIDGLRAFAVLSVIFFHAGFNGFSGGFVGVDVFFVISGYLITRNVLSDIEKNVFTISGFYERRARRILPALFVVMLVSVLCAWLWMSPGDMVFFAKSVFAVLLISSNILFWHESGYFDSAAELKPLLHTWSLAVEEQYYLLFPFVFISLWHCGKRWIFIFLAVFSAASLTLAQLGSGFMPVANFYMLPTRAWEFFIGALVACYQQGLQNWQPSRAMREICGSVGLAAFVFSVFFYDQKTPFPGFYALAPVVGAALILFFATRQTWLGGFLANKFFVGIGLISYSAYLWHQPIFAFARHRGSESPSDLLLIFLVLLSFFIAYFTWKYIETPFRSGSLVSRKRFVELGVMCGVGLLGFSTFAYVNDGFPGSEFDKKISDKKLTDVDFIVLGDSHGEHLLSGLSSITSGRVVDYTSRGCIPFKDVDRYDYRRAPGFCAEVINKNLENIIQSDPSAVLVISAMGPVYLDGTPFHGKDYARVTGLGVELVTDRSIKDRWEVYQIGMRATLSELEKLKKLKIVFALDVPEIGIDYGCNKQGKEVYIFGLRLGDLVDGFDVKNCFVSRAEYDNRTRRYRELVTEIVADFPNVALFDPVDIFCNERICTGFDSRYGFFYRDFDHLTDVGSRIFAEKLSDFLELRVDDLTIGRH